VFILNRPNDNDDALPKKLDREWLLPEWAQAVIVDPISCETEDAVFDVEGQLIFDELNYLTEESQSFSFPENFSYKKIVQGQSVSIPNTQQMLYEGVIDIEGTIDVEGVISDVYDEKSPEPVVEWPENFSYEKIPVGTTVHVPSNQQMIVDTLCDIEGALDLDGCIVLNTDSEPVELPPQNFSYRVIDFNQYLKIPFNQDMLVADSFDIIGILDAEGSFTVINF